MRTPSAKSLTLDLLSTLAGRSMPIAALVAAGKLFGIAEGSVRVAVTRLVAAGQVERDERGRYQLGPAAETIDREVQSWRHLDQRTQRWTGQWLGVHLGGLERRRGVARQRREQALRWMGFAELAPGLRVRPDNLRGGVERVRADLRRLGLDPEALVLRLDGLEPEAEHRAAQAWDAAALERGYERSLAELAQSEARLDRQDEGAAMVESFQLGGHVIRQLTLDPLLPRPLIDSDKRRRLVQAMRRYERHGRRTWARFMARHDAPSARAPVHTGGGNALPTSVGAAR